MYKFMLVILLSIGQISGQCVIPQSWIDRGLTFVDMKFNFTGYDVVIMVEYDVVIMVELTADSVNITSWIPGTWSGPEETTCHQAMVNGSALRVAWESDFPPLMYCDTITPGDNDMALMFQENNDPTTLSINDCQAPYDQFRLGIPVDSSIKIPGSSTTDIFTSFQTLASGTNTSLSQQGTFQVEVTDASGRYCQGDETSTIDVSDNQLILKSCQAKYNLELTWIESFTPEDSAASGSIALLMDLTTSPSYKLYCTRFKEAVSSVTMSVEIGDTDNAICLGHMKYNTATKDIFSFTYSTTGPPIDSSDAVASSKFLLSIICGLVWLALYS